MQDLPIIREFQDAFPKEISGLPPHRDIDLSIDLVPGAALVSRAHSRMSIPELLELKIQLKDLFDKGYIIPSVS